MAARLRWLVIVAAVAVVALAIAIGALSPVTDLIVRARTKIALEQLLAELPAQDLPTAHFSALPAARVRSAMRGAASLSVRSELRVAKLLSIAAESSSADAIAATAAALAIRRESAKAVELLEQAVLRKPGEARLWSDLAAVRFETNEPLRALVAADAALRIEPRFPPALRNRALILDRLGLALVLDETLTSEGTLWEASKQQLLAAAAAGDDATVGRVVGQCPAMARLTAEVLYLGNWAEAAQADPAKANEWLRVARTTGSVLRRRGETLVADAVATIDDAAARGDSRRLGVLTRAHLAYLRGRRAYHARKYEDADRDLREAALLFHAAGSPMEQLALTYTGSLLIRLARIDEASSILSGVLAAERSRSGHRALLAQAELLKAMCDAQLGRWDQAAEAAQRSAVLYRELGETGNLGEAEAMIAVVLDLVGQRERGWEARLRAFEHTSAGGAPDRLLAVVGTATRAAARAQNRDLALSFLDVELELVSRARDPLLSADLFTRRALLQHERGDLEDRDTSVGRARVVIQGIKDREERTRLTIELDAAEAVFIRDTEPRRAIELLGRAVRFCETSNRRLLLPMFLLQRGRTFLAIGDRSRAWQDFAAAIDTLDAQRGAITDLERRARVLDTAEELFEEAIALQVREGNAEEAFRLTERARARTLLDVLGGEARPVAASAEVANLLSPETLLIEYAVLPEELIVFTIRRDGMRMYRVPVSRSELATRADLSPLLLGPIKNELATARRLIIVPDGVLQRVAFGALPWRGQYLVQDHVIAEAPSASRLAVAQTRSKPDRKSVLVVGNPAPDPERNLDALPRVRREIAAIRAIHPGSQVFLGSDATRERFLSEAARYDVLHFAGHGLSDEQSVTAALLFDDGKNGVAPLLSSDIAALDLRRGPLVVLSACGTLRGQIAGVDGMPSLARSFLAAGASAVVGTLTDVDDELVADLLTSFHRKIAEGMPPADALRDAQLEAIARGGAAAEPKNWAPFILYSATP